MNLKTIRERLTFLRRIKAIDMLQESPSIYLPSNIRIVGDKKYLGAPNP